LASKLNSSATGNALTLASGGNFINSYGSTAFNLTGGGRWLIYSKNGASNTLNGLAANFAQGGTSYATSPPSSIGTTGNGLLYSDAAAGTLTFTADDQSRVYGTANPTLTYNFSCSSGCTQASSVTGAPSISTTAVPGSNVGTYSIDVAQGGLVLTAPYTGYNFSFVSGTLTVSKATLTITGVTANNKTYDATTADTLNTASATLSGLFGSDTVTLASGSATGLFADKNAGVGKGVTASGFTISGTDSGNYLLSQPVGLTATISKASLGITGVTANNKTYDTTTADTLGTGSAALSGLLGSDTVTLASGSATGLFADKNAAVGKGVTASGFTITGADSGNYLLSQPLGLTATISKASLGITGVTATDKTYDATTADTLGTGSAALSGLLGSDTVTLASGSATGLFADKNAGVGKGVTASGFTISGIDSGNYLVSQPVGLTATISKASLGITGVTATDKTYDATTADTLSTASAALSGLLGSDIVALASGSASGLFADKNAGVGKGVTASGFTISGIDSGNYLLSQPLGLTATISKATANASLSGTVSKTYDGTVNATLAANNYGISGIFGSDTVVLNNPISGSYNDKNASSGKTVSVNGLTLSGSDAGNYQLASTSVSGTVGTILAKALSILGVSVQDKTYDGTTAATINASSATFSGKIAGDTVNLNAGTLTGAFIDKNAGNGKIVVVSGFSLSGADSSNYTLDTSSFAGTTGNILPKALAVTADNQSMTYGDTLPVLSYQYGSLATGDTASIFNGALATGASSTANTGNYAITQGTLSAGGNYTIGYTQGMVTVAQAMLAITADNASKSQGQANPVFIASYTGFKNGDTAAALTGLNFSSLANAASPTGAYSIIPTGASAMNYTISYANGILTVTPLVIIPAVASNPIPDTVLRVSQDPSLNIVSISPGALSASTGISRSNSNVTTKDNLLYINDITELSPSTDGISKIHSDETGYQSALIFDGMLEIDPLLQKQFNLNPQQFLKSHAPFSNN
jgi:hypothetical protein